MGRRGVSVMLVGVTVGLVAASWEPAAPVASVSGDGALGRRENTDPRFRAIRPIRDIEVVLWADRQQPIGPAGRSPLGTGQRPPLCQAIKGRRSQPVTSRGCGLPLLRPRSLQKTGLAIGARPSRFPLSQAQYNAFAAGIDGAVDREWAKLLRRVRKGVPSIDPAVRKAASAQTEAMRRDPALLSAADELRRATKATLEARLARYRSLVRRYTTWLPGMRRTYVDLAAIRSLSEEREPSPTTVERTITGPWGSSRVVSGSGDDWETSNDLQLLISFDGIRNAPVHARAGFDSSAIHKKYYFRDFIVPSGAGEVEVEVEEYRYRESRLDDCFGFASGWVAGGIMVYRVYTDGSALADHDPVASSWDWDSADALSQITTCGFTVPVPYPPALQARAPTILRFTAPSSGVPTLYMILVYSHAEAEVLGGGTAVVEQDLVINRLVVRYQG